MRKRLSFKEFPGVVFHRSLWTRYLDDIPLFNSTKGDKQTNKKTTFTYFAWVTVCFLRLT